jgi:hypothetical protein
LVGRFFNRGIWYISQTERDSGKSLKNEIAFYSYSKRERERKREFMYWKGTLSLSL